MAVGQAVCEALDETLEPMLQASPVGLGEASGGLVDDFVMVVPGGQVVVSPGHCPSGGQRKNALQRRGRAGSRSLGKWSSTSG